MYSTAKPDRYSTPGNLLVFQLFVTFCITRISIRNRNPPWNPAKSLEF